MNSERKDLRRLKPVIVTAIICIIAVSFFTVTAFATEGFGLFSRSRNIALTITSAEDWDAFADSVLSGNTYAGKTVKLSADITVTRGIGSADITTGQQNPTFAFSGTFDGDGHVLTFLPPADANANYVAPFSIVRDATIANLKVTGKIDAYNNLSGVVGAPAGTVLIENVVSDVDIKGNFAGGFIGHGTSASITLRSCAFTGDLNAATLAGGLICWRGPIPWNNNGNSAVYMENCLFAGTVSGVADFHPIGFTQQTNVTSSFSGMWSTTDGKNGGKGFYNYQYQGASYTSGVAVVAGKSVNAVRPWMGYHDVLTYPPVQGDFNAALAQWTSGSTLALLKDASVSSSLSVSGERTLDLNGRAIKASGSGYSVITVGSGATLTISDNETGGKVTGGSISASGGAGITVNGGTLNLKSGAVSGNTSTRGAITESGGGIGVLNGGKLYMTGGEISGNTSYVGGGIVTDSTNTVVSVTGGVIKNNTTERFGSAIWAGRTSGSEFFIGGDVQVIDNISKWTGDRDGEASINSAVYHISGDPTVIGCWKTTGQSSPYSHLNLDNSGSGVQVIELVGALTNDTGIPKIAISPISRFTDLANGATYVFTKNWEKYMGTANPADYFKVDENVSGVRIIRKNGEAALTGSSDLGDLYIIYDANGGEGTMDPQLVTGTSAKLTANAFTKSDSAFLGWNTKKDGSGTSYADGANVTLSGDLTLYAQWAQDDELFEGYGTEESPFLIQTAADWDALSNYINNGGTRYNDKHFKLTNDISVSTFLGVRWGNSDTSDYVFCGTFDGDNHTLNVNIDTNGFAAPFAIAHNTTIKNLHVTGKVHSSGNHATGLISATKDISPYDPSYIVIQNVTVSTDVSCNSHVAGIIGHAHRSDITIENVVFDGSISASSVQGGFIGWGGISNNGKYNATLKDCLYAGTYRSGVAFHPLGFASGQGNITLVNDLYSTVSWSGGNPLTYTGAGQVKLVSALIEKDGSKVGYDTINNAIANWTVGSTLKLLKDVETSSTIIVPSGEHTLDLNGHGIKRTGSGSVIVVGNDATLNVEDSNPDAEHRFTVASAKSNGAGLATVNDALTSGYQTFNGGYITGGSAQNGGGIKVNGTARLNLNAGTVIGNQSSFMGAGIKADNNGDNANINVFVNGGAVIYNTVNGYGAGICSDGAVSVSDGMVAYNCATKMPGGIHCHYLTLSGGRIENNYGCQEEYVAGAHADHEVYVSGNPVVTGNLLNGTPSNLDWDRMEYQHNHMINITGELTDGANLSVTLRNTVTGVFTSGWSTYMSGKNPADYFTSDNDSYQVFLNDNGEAEIGIPPVVSVTSGSGTTGYSSLSEAVANWTVGSTLKLLKDVETSSTIIVPSGEHTLDLNGHGIKMIGSGMVINVGNDSILNLYDNDTTTTHKFDVPEGAGLAVLNESGGNYTVNGGYITGGNSSLGGGIYIDVRGTLNMYGGTVIGNQTSVHGGGIGVSSPNGTAAVLNMVGGTVCYNTSAWGGGINVFATAYLREGCLIHHNAVTNGGGGIELENGGKLYMNGGSVTDNVVLSQNGGMWKGGGIHLPNGAECHIKGNVQVMNNYKETYGTAQSNFFVRKEASGKVIFDGALSSDASVGFGTNGTVPFIVTSGYGTYHDDTDPMNYFISDNSDYIITLRNGEAAIALPHTHDWHYTVNGATITAVCEGDSECDLGTQTLTISANSKTFDGKPVTATLTKSDGWTSDNDLDVSGTITYSGNTDVGTYSASIKAGNVTASCEFTISPAELTITADAKTKVYGETDPELTYTYEGLFSGSSFTGKLSRESGENVGTYAITQGTLSAGDNYEITYTGANLTITEAQMSITATGYNGDYDGEEHGITIIAPDGAVVKYGTVSGEYTLDESPKYTEAGTYTVYYRITKANYKTVKGSKTVKINQIDAVVTITGHNTTVDYDGMSHSITGYDATVNTALYDLTKDYTFSGEAYAKRTNAGTTYMELAAEQFENTNANFATVTFDVTDGYVKVNPIDATVTITGHNLTVKFDGTSHSVSGYDAVTDNMLYNVTKDFTFSGTETISRTNAGTTHMKLAASQFKNTNSNFATVTFEITDGYITVNPIDAMVTITGHSSVFDYDGTSHSVSGYDAVASTDLYDVTKDFTFSGNDVAELTKVGTVYMGLTSGQFENTNKNFATVTFEVIDGFVTVNPIGVTITITGHTDTVDYDGTEHSVTGYDAVANTDLYDVSADFTFSGEAKASGTDAGKYDMGLTAEQFENTNPCFDVVTFNVTDGCLRINKINATVTIVGESKTLDYDGESHTVKGYTATADTELYDVENDFTFSGDAKASRKNAGTTHMGLAPEQFSNVNDNFEEVEFIVTDGYVTINKINAVVTIVGHNDTLNYDGQEHTVSGYTATADTELYDVDKDFTFSGVASISRTDAGKSYMGLSAEQFANVNNNFDKVTFDVTDGYLNINTINAVVTIVGNSSTLDYDGEEHTVIGYTAKADTDLYDVDVDFEFSGNAEISRIDAGTTSMGLASEQFANINGNFAEVTFEVTDGYLTINRINAVVTVVGNNDTLDYDGTEHNVNGYTAVSDTKLFDVDKDFTFSGSADISRTNAGTTHMGLSAEQFENTNDNFAEVTFEVTDGYLTINKINAIVTIVGNNDTLDYDGEEHSVSGYTVTVDNELFDLEKDYTFSGEADISATDAGTTHMGLSAEQFEKTNDNFAEVTFDVTDGYLMINKINASVIIVGENGTYDYDGEEHTASGYTAASNSELYDVEKDFVFSGNDTVSLTDAGSAYMGLASEQFKNVNPNFAVVEFEVADGYIVINTVDAVIVKAPVSADPIYNGSEVDLVKAGKAEGGTLYYAVNDSPVYAPADDAFTPDIPTAKETGSYYVWYKVVADGNHNDLEPSFVRVILAEKDWVTLSGVVYENDGKTVIENAVITLMRGNSKIDYVITDENGTYKFIAHTGAYNVTAEYQQNKQTFMVKLFADMVQDIVMSGSKTEVHLEINSNDDNTTGIAVDGLDEEANSVRDDGNVSDEDSVSVVMTVASQSEADSSYAEAISERAKDKSFIFFNARIEITIATKTTIKSETTNVIEIAVPYEKVNKRGLAVYYADGEGIRRFTESESREDGTFIADKENGIVYIYTSRFSTFGIGYTPYFEVKSTLSFGTFEGEVSVTITSESGRTYKLENVSLDRISFADIPKGEYVMTVTWIDGVENTLTFPIKISEVKAANREQAETRHLSAANQDNTSISLGTSEPDTDSSFMLAARRGSKFGIEGILSDDFGIRNSERNSETSPNTIRLRSDRKVLPIERFKQTVLDDLLKTFRF